MDTKKDLLFTQKGYYLTISKCPLTCWENRFDIGYSAIRVYTEIDEDNNIIDSRNGKIVKGVIYNEESDYEAWDVLYTDFRNKVKEDPDFALYLTHIDKLIDLQHKYITSGREHNGLIRRDRSILNHIKLIKARIEGFEKTMTGGGKTINQVLMDLSKAQGYQLKKSELMAEDYFDLIEKYKAKSNG